ncbi:MAG: AgmX/PglI C-terminal domain-containing protein [Desulfobacteraceae bacterium]|jgi:hypothetical protein
MKDAMTGNNEHEQGRENMTTATISFVSQFYVFSGETYLGWDCFDSSSVKVGGSAFADLVLDDPDLDDIQAEFVISNGRIRVVNLGREGRLTVNNRAVSESAVGSFDVVKIGKYTVKAKLKKMTGMADQLTMDQTPLSISEAQEKPVRDTSEIKADVQVTPKEVTPVGKDSQQPDIVRNLLTLMDQYDDLDFDSIEEILTTKTEEKKDEPPVVSVAKKPKTQAPIFDEVTDRFKPASLNAGVKKQPEQIETIKRPTPHSLVTDARNGKDRNELETEQPSLKSPELTSIIQSVITPDVEDAKPVELQAKPKQTNKKTENSPEPLKAERVKLAVKETNSFPASFFNQVPDEEDEEDDDFSANFTLREKLTGESQTKDLKASGERVLEIIRFKGGNVHSISHLKDEDEHVLVHGKETFCRVKHSESKGTRMFFSKPLLGTINKVGEKELKAEMGGKGKFGSRTPVYSSLLPVKGELTLSDGFYDYVIRKSILPPDPVISDSSIPAVPLHQRIIESTAFKYSSRAVIFHIILLIVFSYSVTMPDKTEFKNPETYFVKVETEDIRKPVKPLPRPKPVMPTPVQDMSTKKAVVEKESPKETMKMAAREQTSPKVTPTSRPEPADPGSGKAGNVVNKNVNQVGLLAALGKKTGISLAPNEALASVTNMDAITSRRGNEANVKLGGIVGNLGDSKIAIPAGGVINNKGGAGVYRSAGIGGKGSVAALGSGKTGKRAVKAVVAAPVAKKVRASGGGISREAVAKVINDHMDEVNACYESALVNDSNLLGRIEFEWTILQSGDVGDVKIKSSTVKSSQLHSCIISAIKSWKFPKPNGADVIVSYPFVFDITGF